MNKISPLGNIRKDIDKTDKEILGLLSMRGDLVKKVKEIKVKEGIPIRDLDREKDHIKDLLELNRQSKNPLSEEAIEEIFKSIIKHSVLFQNKD